MMFSFSGRWEPSSAVAVAVAESTRALSRDHIELRDLVNDFVIPGSLGALEMSC